MTTNVDRHKYFVGQALSWIDFRAKRQAELRRHHAGKDRPSVDRLVDADPEVKDSQILCERAVALATMFGIGAILDELQRR